MINQQKRGIYKHQYIKLVIILLLIWTTLIPLNKSLPLEEQPISNIPNSLTLPILHGNILYVGGDGHGNYSKIQYAIENASNGDTIYIYAGVYFERITVNKSLTLMGEKKRPQSSMETELMMSFLSKQITSA